jgi:hypothetical protein
MPIFSNIAGLIRMAFFICGTVSLTDPRMMVFNVQ